MIDLFTLALTHGLMALAAFILLSRKDLDEEGDMPLPRWKRPPAARDAGED